MLLLASLGFVLVAGARAQDILPGGEPLGFAGSSPSAAEHGSPARNVSLPNRGSKEAHADTPKAGRRELAVNSGNILSLYDCDFGENWDKNYDRWPDGWTREISSKYPHYLKIGIVPIDPEPGTDTKLAGIAAQALRINLDGGAAWLRSPEIPVNPLFMYQVDVNVRISALKHDRVWMSMTYYDAKRQSIAAVESRRMRGTQGWEKLSIGPVLPPKNTITYVVLELHVEPEDKTADLRGTIEFTNLHLGRFPKITLASNRADRIYIDPERPEIICEASGFQDPAARIVFELLDLNKVSLAIVEKPLRRAEETPQLAVPPKPANENEATSAEAPLARAPTANDAPVYSGSVSWKPPINSPGYYYVRVQMPGELGTINRRELSLIILRPLPGQSAGEFGWSMPEGEGPLSIGELADLAGQGGIHYLKMPVWSSSEKPARMEQLLWLSERLSLKRIQMVGMLSDPPEIVRNAVSGGNIDLAAGIFSAPEQVWYPSLEPLISRLSVRVAHWQLGGDTDQSFTGYAEGNQRIVLLRKLFSRFGQQLRFSIGWDWLRELPEEKPAWDTAVLGAKPGLTADEQTAYLDATANVPVKRWVLIEPIPAEEFSLETRIADLTQRMITAKAGRAEGIFVPRLFSDSTGLLNSDGSAGPLFVPWRTVCYQLSGSEFMGSLPLDPSIKNYIFHRRDESTMAIWSAHDQEVRLQLGHDVKLLTPWGQELTPRREGDEVVLQLTNTPVLVTHVHTGLVRLQMSTTLAKTRWASFFGRPQSNALVLTNGFGQSVSGKVRLIWPEAWHLPDRELPFKISPRDTIQVPFEVTLPINAGTGRQTVVMEFEVAAERTYRFRTTRDIDVGLDDLFAEFETRLTSKGDLEIEQRLTNRTDETVSFKCYLYAPGRKRLTLQVLDHGQGIDVKIFQLPNAAELVGKDLQLRLMEVNGARILNYAVKVKP
jgi:hypothetical protein